MEIKHMIGSVLITAGVLASFAAVGHLDYLDARGGYYGSAEVKKRSLRVRRNFRGYHKLFVQRIS